MKQIIILKGGNSFKSEKDFYAYLKEVPCSPQRCDSKKGWHEWLCEKLFDQEYRVHIPLMPNRQNSNYEAWKIWFERNLEYIDKKEPLTIVAQSLGVSFILKYLQDEEYTGVINQLHLVSGWVSRTLNPLENLNTFSVNFDVLPSRFTCCELIHIWHSKDDTECPFENCELLERYIPQAKVTTFENRGHFRQDTFPELLTEVTQ